MPSSIQKVFIRDCSCHTFRHGKLFVCKKAEGGNECDTRPRLVWNKRSTTAITLCDLTTRTGRPFWQETSRALFIFSKVWSKDWTCERRQNWGEVAHIECNLVLNCASIVHQFFLIKDKASYTTKFSLTPQTLLQRCCDDLLLWTKNHIAGPSAWIKQYSQLRNPNPKYGILIFGELEDTWAYIVGPPIATQISPTTACVKKPFPLIHIIFISARFKSKSISSMSARTFSHGNAGEFIFSWSKEV